MDADVRLSEDAISTILYKMEKMLLKILLLEESFFGLFGTGFYLVFSIFQRNLQFNHNTIFYILYTIQLFYIGRYVGNFGFIIPILHFIPSTFFIFVFINSIYRYYIRGEIFWKERKIFIKG